MRDGKLILTSLVCLVALTTLIGCVSKDLDNQLVAHRKSTTEQTLELAQLNQSEGSVLLDWKTARKLLSERNLSLRQARSRVELIKKQRDEQWKTWLPRIGVQANLQNSLAQLGSLAFSELSTSVIAPLNIPNPLTERAIAFENALSYLESQDSFELSYRRQVVSLYRIFSRFENISGIEEQADNSGQDLSPVKELGKLETAAAHDESVKSLQGELAQLLNMPGEQPTPIPSTRPKLNYETRISHLVPGGNYGQLAVRLSAYRLEGALLREKGIKLRKWPSWSVSSSSPAAYDSRSSDSDGYLDTDRILLFGGLSKSYDFTGIEASRIQSAEENTQFVKENLRLRLDQDAREWLRLRSRYDQLLLKKKLAKERLDLIRKKSGGSSASAELSSLREALRTIRMIDQSKEQLELEVWIWDDQKWN